MADVTPTQQPELANRTDIPIDPNGKPAPVRINLGSGERYQPGWLNVDLYAKRADVRQDIRTVCFPENYADEIQAIHVIEHVNRAEGEQLIEKCAGWLKPGGRLVIETPDREKCLRLLKHQRTRWRLMGAKGLFGGRSGDKAFKLQWHNWLLAWSRSGVHFEGVTIPHEYVQPGHAHLCVWTGLELERAMDAAGLVAHRSRPEHHGGRVKRDCRVVGTKTK